MTELVYLNIEKKRWGEDEGKLSGRITFEDRSFDITLKTDEEFNRKLLELCAGHIAEVAAMLSKELTKRLEEEKSTDVAV